MLDRPGEAIKLPYQDDIERPLAGVMHKRVELGTLALGAAHPLIHKFVAAAKALAGITAEVVELQLATLVAYSGDVNGGFQRDVNRRSGDVNKVGAQRRWNCNHA